MRKTLLIVTLVASCKRNEGPDPCQPSPDSIHGCYEFVEATGNSKSVFKGTLLQLGEKEMAFYSDIRAWSRVPMTWSAPTEKLLAGKTGAAEVVEVKVVGAGKVQVLQQGQELGTALHLGGEAATQAKKMFDAVPTFDALVVRSRKCFEQYGELMPGDDSYAQVHPELWRSSTSALALMGAAQLTLAEKCRPVPKECEMPNPSSSFELELAKSAEKCAGRAP